MMKCYSICKLGDVVEQIRGVSYKPEDLHTVLDSESITLLRANNIQDGRVIFDDVVYVDCKRVKNTQRLKKGDILICTSSGSKDLVGKAAVVKEDTVATFGAFCKVVRVKREAPQYIACFFDSPQYRNRISQLSAGANINNIRGEHINELEISLPPLDTQRHIAAVLDKVSDLIALRKQQLAKLDDLVKARFVEMFGNVMTYKPMSDICSIITDGTHQPPNFVAGGIPFIFVSNIVGNKISYNAEKFISLTTYNELIKRTPIEIGDVLLSTVGSYGHPAVVKSDQKFLFQRHIAYLKPKHDLINSDYLHGAILAPDVQKQIETAVKGVAQKTLNLAEIKKLVIPVPSIKQQEQFAAFVEKVEQSKATVQRSLDKLETLKSALMQEYFG